ncbi:hypothetical protein J6590_057263, partial [Homalodisca vitripennis]
AMYQHRYSAIGCLLTMVQAICVWHTNVFLVECHVPALLLCYRLSIDNGSSYLCVAHGTLRSSQWSAMYQLSYSAIGCLLTMVQATPVWHTN